MLYSHRDLKFAPERDRLILDLCRDRRVLHIGAADSPFTEEKLRAGLLLHARLREVSRELCGVDLDRQAVEWLRDRGFDDLVYADVTRMDEMPLAAEVIVFGETLEHLGDPAGALRSLRELMTDETRLVISTPNLPSLYFFAQLLQHRETHHPDHVVGFSYGLLVQLAASCGLEVTDLWFTFLDRERIGFKDKLWRTLSRRWKGLAETLLAICRRRP